MRLRRAMFRATQMLEPIEFERLPELNRSGFAPLPWTGNHLSFHGLRGQ